MKAMLMLIIGGVVLAFGAINLVSGIVNPESYVSFDELGLVVGPLYLFFAILMPWMFSLSKDLGKIKGKLGIS